jgi:hypothetical protein
MFRFTKKKTFRKTRTKDDENGDDGSKNENGTALKKNSTTNDNSDIDEDDGMSGVLTMALQQRKKKLSQKKRKVVGGGKSSAFAVRSFDVEEHDDVNDESKSSSKRREKKRKRGLGFGGGADGGAMEGKEGGTDDADDSEDALAPSSYGKEALEKLKAMQKQKKQKVEIDSNRETQNQTSLRSNDIAVNFDTTTPKAPEEVFISLDENPQPDENVILNADSDNLEHIERLVEETAANPEETEMWNEQIERRAGIKVSTSNQTKPSLSKLMSLDELSRNMKSAIQVIKAQQEELQNTINRRKADREHALVDKQAQQRTVAESGEACEYFQKLRHNLTLWVGALRDVQQKLDPIQQAFQEMLEAQCDDVNHEFQSLQDDCIAVLEESGLLKQVFGRQPKTPINSGASIDEFGRDVRSQYLRDRDLRFQTRQKKHSPLTAAQTSEKSSCYEKIVVSLYEDHNEKDRCDTLHEALRTALQDLEQGYTSVDGLKTIFKEWQSTYPEDFKQCFASLSLGDLLAVILRLDFCKSLWFQTILLTAASQNDVNDAHFPEEMEALLATDDVVDNDCRRRAVEKSLYPFVKGALENYSSCGVFLSQEKSAMMSTLVNTTKNYLGPLSKQLEKTLSDAIVKTLDAIAIPILNTNFSNVTKYTGAIQEFSINFSTTHLVEIIQKMLCNMILHWCPLLAFETEDSNNGIHAVLTFISEKFLMLLSATDKEKSKEFFGAVWQALKNDPRNVVESPLLLVTTMPLRAAACAYGLA